MRTPHPGTLLVLTHHPALLPVPLHLADRPHLRVRRILAELPAGPPLAQQVPALVEGGLGGGQLPVLVVGGYLTGCELGAQLVLGLNEIVDVRQDLPVVHALHRIASPRGYWPMDRAAAATARCCLGRAPVSSSAAAECPVAAQWPWSLAPGDRGVVPVDLVVVAAVLVDVAVAAGELPGELASAGRVGKEQRGGEGVGPAGRERDVGRFLGEGPLRRGLERETGSEDAAP